MVASAFRFRDRLSSVSRPRPFRIGVPEISQYERGRFQAARLFQLRDSRSDGSSFKERGPQSHVRQEDVGERVGCLSRPDDGLAVLPSEEVGQCRISCDQRIHGIQLLRLLNLIDRLGRAASQRQQIHELTVCVSVVWIPRQDLSEIALRFRKVPVVLELDIRQHHAGLDQAVVEIERMQRVLPRLWDSLVHRQTEVSRIEVGLRACGIGERVRGLQCDCTIEVGDCGREIFL